MNLKEKEIQDVIFKDYHGRGHYPITLNFHGLGLRECDVISISGANYIYEFEIKVSRPDFKADLKNKAGKHFDLENGYGIKRYDACRAIKRPDGTINFKKIPDALCMYSGPNYFHYVCPEGLIKLEEVPEYAGLIYVVYENDFPKGLKEVKPARLLHKERANFQLIKEIARNLTNKLLLGCSFTEYKFISKWAEKLNTAVTENNQTGEL